MRLDHITPKTPGVLVEALSNIPLALLLFRTPPQRESEAAVKELPGGHSEREPPDPFPNSEVKTLSADDSVGSPHAKVGHCQAFIPKPRW